MFKLLSDIWIELSSFIHIAYTERNHSNMALFVLWSIGVIVGIVILVSLFFAENKAALISAFAILISAFMASVAMLKSIQRSESEHQEKLTIEKAKILKSLYYMLLRVSKTLQQYQRSSKKYSQRLNRDNDILMEQIDRYINFLEERENFMFTTSKNSNGLYDLTEDLILIQTSLKEPVSAFYVKHGRSSSTLQRNTLKHINNAVVLIDNLINEIAREIEESIDLFNHDKEISKLFIGKRTNEGIKVFFDNKPLALYLDVKDHSPTGFEWGYNGSGPRQLALAILMTTTNNKEKSLLLYDKFHEDKIQSMNKDYWMMTKDSVLDWISHNELFKKNSNDDNKQNLKNIL